MIRRFGLFGALLLVLGIVYVAAWRTQPRTSQAAGQPAAQSVPVTSVTRSCPPAATGTGAAHIAMIALPSRAATVRAGTAGPGSATLSSMPVTPPAAKQPSKQPTAAAPQPVTVTAAGAPATVTAPETHGAAGQGGTPAFGGTRDSTNRVAFAADPNGNILVFDTFFYGLIYSIPVRDPIIGPLRVAKDAGGNQLLFGVTARGLVMVRLPTIPNPNPAPPRYNRVRRP